MKKPILLIGVLCLVAFCVIGAGALQYSGGVPIGENKIVPIPTYVPPTTGTIHIFNLAHDGWFSNEAYVYPDTQNVTPENDGSIVDQILAADGSGWIIVPNGQYVVYLPDGNGGQPETRHITISGGCVADAMFIGHASGGGSGSPTFTITSAQYGATDGYYGTMVDVTAYFQSVIHGTTHSVTVTDPSGPDWAWLHAIQTVQTGFTDPASGIEKGLVINYEVNNGKLNTLVVPNVYDSSTGYVVTGNSATLTL